MLIISKLITMKYTLLLFTMLCFVLNAHSQNVGINNPAPNTTLDVNGALALRETAISMANGDNNNVVIGERSFFRITGPTAAFAITGLANGINGKLVTLYNATAFAFTVKNLDASSAAANQVKTLTGADIVFAAANSSVTLQYSLQENKWIVIAQQSPEPVLTLNQSAASAFGSAGLTVLPTSPQTLIPGLTQTITVPAGSVVYLSSAGGVQTTAAVATGFSVVDVLFAIDGIIVPNGGYQRVFAANTGGVTASMISYWSLSTAVTLTAGAHTFAVLATGVSIAGASNATLSGNNTSVLQGTLTVAVLKK